MEEWNMYAEEIHVCATNIDVAKAIPDTCSRKHYRA